MGRLIPAGTGLEEYKGMGIQVELPPFQPSVETHPVESTLGSPDVAELGGEGDTSFRTEVGPLDG